MSNWTVDQLAAYTKRVMKESPRQREKMLVKSNELMADKLHRKATAHGAGKGSLDASKSRNGYNTAVVLAWFKECGLPEPVPEYQFDFERKWRFDFAWSNEANALCVNEPLALEVQGGLFSGGAHVRGAALLREHEKLNRAAVLGWRVMFTMPQDLCTKDLADQIRAALAI